MFNYFTFMRKELTENIRTKRLLVLGCVFIFFAVTSPLLARYMGEFINFLLPAGDEAAQLLVQAMPPPSWEEKCESITGKVGTQKKPKAATKKQIPKLRRCFRERRNVVAL